MITLNRTMDHHSVDIMRDGEKIGMYQWHPERPKRFIFQESWTTITLTDMEEILRQAKAIKP